MSFARQLDEPRQLLLADAQTSGGLLMAVGESELESLLADLAVRRTPVAAVIGRVVEASLPGHIEVTCNV